MAKILEHGNRYRGRARKKPAGVSKTFLCAACYCRFKAGPLEFYATGRADPFTGEAAMACRCPECGQIAEEMDYK